MMQQLGAHTMYRLGCDDNKVIPSTYNRVWVHNTWGPKQPLMYLTFGHKIEPKIEDWFLNPGVFL